MSIVLDPFVGSGTTIRVCRKLDRHFIGIDINPECAKLVGLEPNTDYNKPLDSIYIGDCLEIMTKLYEIHGPFVDLIYADPPFGRNSTDKQFGIDWRKFPIDLDLLNNFFGNQLLKCLNYETKAYLTWFYPRLDIMYKLLKDTGSIYIHNG